MKSIVKKSKVYRVSATALGACALGAFAIGTVALGALAVGRLAIARLVLGKGTLRSLQVQEISVDRLKVGDVEVARTLKLPPAVGQPSLARPLQEQHERRKPRLNSIHYSFSDTRPQEVYRPHAVPYLLGS